MRKVSMLDGAVYIRLDACQAPLRITHLLQDVPLDHVSGTVFGEGATDEAGGFEHGLWACGHGDTIPRPRDHVQVVVAVADGHHLVAWGAEVMGKDREGFALRAVGVGDLG